MKTINLKIFWLIYIIIMGCFTLNSYARELVIGEFSNSLSAENTKSKELLIKAYKSLVNNNEKFKDITLKFEYLPGIRSLIESNKGRIDGELMRKDKINLEFKNLVKVNVPISKIQIVAYSTKDNLKINGWKSLINKKVGSVRGLKIVEEKYKEFSIKNVTLVKNEQEGFKLLASNKIDFYIDSDDMLTLAHKKYKKIFILQPPLETLNLYHYLNKKNIDIVKPLEKELSNLEKNEGNSL